jgi:hypothetical protein
MVGPRAISLASVATQLDEGAVFELDDGWADGEELDAGVIRRPGLLLFRRLNVLGQY